MKLRILMGLFSLLTSSFTCAQIYKYIDEAGRTVYSDIDPSKTTGPILTANLTKLVALHDSRLWLLFTIRLAEENFLNGEVFDDSGLRGQDITGPIAGFIPGIHEALTLMNKGDKWVLYIPPRLALLSPSNC